LIKKGQPPTLATAKALLEAYDEAKFELERIQARLGDLEFHYEVFQHLMIDRKELTEKLANLGLEVFSAPDDRGSWSWAWRWRENAPVSGFESSVGALQAALESLLGLPENPDPGQD
jgi:hypothetical protein